MPVFRLHFLFVFLLCGIIVSARSRETPNRLTSALTDNLLWHPRYYFYSVLKTVRTSLSTTNRAGFTLDDCATDVDCVGDRRCFNNNDDPRLCAGEDGCECKPPDNIPIACTDSLKCDKGETCASNGNKSLPFCLSDDVIRDRGFTVVFGPPGDGYTLDVCSDTSDCKAPRRCVLATDVSEPCEDTDPCVCNEPTGNCCEEECIPEEVCTENTEKGGIPFCASPLALERRDDLERTDCASPPPTSTPSPTQGPTKDPASTPSPSPNPQSPSPTPTPSPLPPVETDPPRPLPCISTHLLEHLSESELLFKKHAWSKVLCDAQMSCATPGHVVIFKGRAMMMGSYCKIVGCARRVMQVNSPRYRKKHRVRSMTEGLEFTVFAARYETIVEEQVIALAVKMGL